MDESFKRHKLFPYVFEEQTMILIDNAGNRETRKLRRFSRMEDSGTVKYLFVFDSILQNHKYPRTLDIRSSFVCPFPIFHEP